MRFTLARAAVIALLVSAAAAQAQEERLPGAVTSEPSNAELRAGYYEMTLTIRPANCLTQSVGGTARGVVEVTAGRRENLIIHLERLNSLFAGPVPVAIDHESRLGFGGQVPIIVAGLRMGVRGILNGAFERGRERFEADFELAARLCKITGTIEGIRTSAPPPPPPPPAPAETPTGALLNSDGYVVPPPPEPAPAQRPPPSPLIAGKYATSLTINGRRCIQNVSGTWQRPIDVAATPTISIPLNEYNSLFSGPVVLNVSGLDLSQTARIPLSVGGSVPATFVGGFSHDGSRVDVRFEVRAPLCSLDGRIEGAKL